MCGLVTAEELIEENTLLPIYRPFASEHAFTTVVSGMEGNWGTGIKLRLGLTASGFLKHASFRYCKDCVLADNLNHGVAYWHRIHMLPGVCACPLHERWLMTQVSDGAGDWRRMLLPAEGMGTPISECSGFGPAVEVAKLQQWGLANPDQVKILIERGFIRHCLEEQGLIRRARLCEQSIAKQMMLQLALCPPIAEFAELVQSSDWIIRLLRPRGKIVQPFSYFFFLWLMQKNLDSIRSFIHSELTLAASFKKVTKKTGYVPTSQSICDHRIAYLKDTQIRCHNRTGYFWLYRNDRNWLIENLRGLTNSSSSHPRVDWALRDYVFANSILKTSGDLLTTELKPIKVTRSSLARAIQNGFMMLRCISKLPHSAQVLSRVVESEHDFQIRKLTWAVRTLPYPMSLQPSLVVRQAGIRLRKFEDNELTDIIQASRPVVDIS